MKFGQSNNIDELNLELPQDHIGTAKLLDAGKRENFKLFVGFPTWNKTKLENFYPLGVKDELTYYSSQFNAIELNASYYRIFPKHQFEKWRNKTPDDFKFFPKVVQNISHWKRLNETDRLVDEMVYAFEGLEEKLGRAFLQMHNNFSPKDFDRVVKFCEYWPKSIPLAMEFRHSDWHSDLAIANDLYHVLETHSISNIITDTVGRRDLLHMRLTTQSVFVRFTGAVHQSDTRRLDDWVERLAKWADLGIKEIAFFIHQNAEKESTSLAAYFLEKMNARFNMQWKIPAENLSVKT